MQEVSKIVPLYEEVSYEKLGAEGIRLGLYNIGNRIKALFIPVEADDTAQKPDRDYPFILLSGSIIFHSGSLSTKSPELNQVGPGGWVEVSAEDAKKYQLEEGQLVSVKSPRGGIEVKARISKNQMKGTVFIPYHFESQPVNTLTGKDLTPTFVNIKKV